MLTIKEIIKYNNNPSEWSGILVNNELFYIVYKWGLLSITIGSSTASVDIGDPYDNKMSTETLKELTKVIFNWDMIK